MPAAVRVKMVIDSVDAVLKKQLALMDFQRQKTPNDAEINTKFVENLSKIVTCSKVQWIPMKKTFVVDKCLGCSEAALFCAASRILLTHQNKKKCFTGKCQNISCV